MEDGERGQELEAEAEQGLGQQQGQPGEADQQRGGQVEREQEGGEGATQQDLHPVHGVVPCDQGDFRFHRHCALLSEDKTSKTR